jgi:hypothetical protein
MNYVQTRTQGTYSAPTTGDGTVITPLDIVFTPKKSGNLVILEWIVNGEPSATSVVFNVLRNGTPLPNSNDGVNQWSGIAVDNFDNDSDSTPSNIKIKIVDESSLDSESTYSVTVRSSWSNARTFYLNRTVASAGTLGYEALMSIATAMEINT